jgi:hypothetical protein
MSEYVAKSNTSLSFDLTKEGHAIGKLSYQSWFRFDAEIALANDSSYQLAPKGFWGTTMALKDGESVLLKFKMNWNGSIVVQTFFNGIEKGYVLKHKGLFKESFVLVDEQGAELLVMIPHLQWFKMNFEYKITTSESFETLSHKEILLLNSIHCANYYMAVAMSAVVPGG